MWHAPHQRSLCSMRAQARARTVSPRTGAAYVMLRGRLDGATAAGALFRTNKAPSKSEESALSNGGLQV